MYENTSNNQGKDDIININIDENDSEKAVILFYELYKNSDVNELPNSYWISNGKVKAKYIVRHVVKNILKYDSREKVIHKLSIKDFKTAKLNNMLTILFDGDLFEAIDNAYPNKYTKEMFVGQRNYWDVELLKEEVERIAKEKGKPVNKLRLRETAPCLYGGEKIFHRLCGGFDNFIRLYYPEEHWWIPRRKGEKRKEYTKEQEKEMIQYVLVEYRGIDIADTKTFHHVTCRDFYENHLRFLCDKYDYDVEKMVHMHFPKLKICNYVLNNYEIVSPDGEIFKVNSIRKWVIENRDRFPETIKEKTINCALVSTANPNSGLKSYRGWKAIKIINEYNR